MPHEVNSLAVDLSYRCGGFIFSNFSRLEEEKREVSVYTRDIGTGRFL